MFQMWISFQGHANSVSTKLVVVSPQRGLVLTFQVEQIGGVGVLCAGGRRLEFAFVDKNRIEDLGRLKAGLLASNFNLCGLDDTHGRCNLSQKRIHNTERRVRRPAYSGLC